METTREIKRSALWKQIYDKVKQMPRAQTDGDAVDHISLTTTLEELFINEGKKFKGWYDKLLPSEKCTVWSMNGDATGLFTLSDEAIVKKYIDSKKD